MRESNEWKGGHQKYLEKRKNEINTEDTFQKRYCVLV